MEEQSRTAAHRLLTQLRTVARELSFGLDVAALATALATEVSGWAPAERVAVLTLSGDRLVPMAVVGPGGGAPVAPALAWDIDLAGRNAFAEAWVSQLPQVRETRHPCNGAAGAGSALALPLRMGLRCFGLVGLESGGAQAYPADVVAAVELRSSPAVLALCTALLVEDIREVSTSQERRRLGREMHDGLAQQIAALGYRLDDLATRAAEAEPLEADLRELRAGVTRLVEDLRLSILNLRRDVVDSGGLGAALAGYVREVGGASPLAVHLALEEATQPLPPELEAELFRIAQEAITNVRRHADAANLWVTCVIRPPDVVLRIEDDGRGLPGGPGQGGHGLEIMRERAERLRGRLTVGPRLPRGTSVVVRLAAGGLLTAAPPAAGTRGARGPTARRRTPAVATVPQRGLVSPGQRGQRG